MSDNGNSKLIQEMKYEGLTALIIEGQEHAKERHDDFKEFIDHRFTGLEKYNEKQNGSIQKTKDRVLVLEQGSRYTKLLKWIDTHPKRSIVIILSIGVVLSGTVMHAVAEGWIPELWRLIIKIVT